MIKAPDEAVDPTEAERFLDGVLVADARRTRVLLVEYEPDLGRGAVVLLEPCVPRRTRADVERCDGLSGHAIASRWATA